MALAAIDEAVAVGRAKGVALPEEVATNVQKGFRSAPAETKASMLVDLERGKKMELPWLSATVADLGDELGVPAPTHRVIATVLGPHARGSG